MQNRKKAHDMSRKRAIYRKLFKKRLLIPNPRKVYQPALEHKFVLQTMVQVG